jgi:hypothetical protein
VRSGFAGSGLVVGAAIGLACAAGCAFRPATSRDARGDAAPDAPPDATPAVCGNGVVEPGEACEPDPAGAATACSTSCGTTGTRTCNARCQYDPCAVTIDPATAWQVSTDGTTWAPVMLPDTNWGCTNCTRYYRTDVCDQPTAVAFQWASDNKAKMTVGGGSAFDQYFVAGYCTDQTCCAKYCDSTADCLAALSPLQMLGSAALGLFAPGSNVVRWEVSQETGGAGFYTTMTVTY